MITPAALALLEQCAFEPTYRRSHDRQWETFNELFKAGLLRKAGQVRLAMQLEPTAKGLKMLGVSK